MRNCGPCRARRLVDQVKHATQAADPVESLRLESHRAVEDLDGTPMGEAVPSGDRGDRRVGAHVAGKAEGARELNVDARRPSGDVRYDRTLDDGKPVQRPGRIMKLTADVVDGGAPELVEVHQRPAQLAGRDA